MKKLTTLEQGKYFHVFNRGNNRENIFLVERNYSFFLNLYTRYIEPVAETSAYCLMKNHFHLLVRIREKQTCEVSETSQVWYPVQQFSNFFNSYAKSINKVYHRTGSLFQKRFGRIEVTSDAYLTDLVHYIHFNPQKHGFVADFRDYPYSSYQALLSDMPTRLNRKEVLDWFGGRESFDAVHRSRLDEKKIGNLVEGDPD